MRAPKVPDQVSRLAVLFIAAAVIVVLARHHFVPKTFGELGHYRAAAVDSIAKMEIKYAGMQACLECHSDVGDAKAKSYHRGLSCEVCHGPASLHATDPDSHKPMIPRERGACLYCHDYLPSRPTGFPQIIERVHNPMKPCITCHNPHDPTPPRVPGACSACHASIARTKSISRHAALECETCHEAPPEHKLDPRANVPKKPTAREFCGKCHATDADSAAEIPRVEMATHGGRYLCWQCHYPHSPEAR